MQSFRFPTAMLAALVAFPAIIIAFLQLTVTILTFDPSGIHDAIQKSVVQALTQTGVQADTISVIAPIGGVQTASYLNSWNSVPLVTNYVNGTGVDGPDGTLAVSEFMAIVVDTFNASGNVMVSPETMTRAATIVESFSDAFAAWQQGELNFAGLDSFSPSPAGQLLVAGATFEVVVFLALIGVLVAQGYLPRVALGGIAFISMVAMTLLFASAGVIKGVVAPYLENSPVEVMPAIAGSGTAGPISVGALANYIVDPTFQARQWAAAALSLVTTLLCFALVVQPAPPEKWRPSWLARRSTPRQDSEKVALAGRISPPYNPSGSTEEALEVRAAASEESGRLLPDEARFSYAQLPAQREGAVSPL